MRYGIVCDRMIFIFVGYVTNKEPLTGILQTKFPKYLSADLHLKHDIHKYGFNYTKWTHMSFCVNNLPSIDKNFELDYHW